MSKIIEVRSTPFMKNDLTNYIREDSMSNFICPTCGFNDIDCGKAGYKTDREVELENALKDILAHGPACQHDQDCPLNDGDGYDQGCATCACVIAKKALKGEKI